MQEKERVVLSGWMMLVVTVLAWSAFVYVFVRFCIAVDATVLSTGTATLLIVAIILIPTALLLTFGLFTLQTNEARVLVVLCSETQAEPVINTGTLYH